MPDDPEWFNYVMPSRADELRRNWHDRHPQWVETTPTDELLMQLIREIRQLTYIVRVVGGYDLHQSGPR